tara:strand:- start:290 stop:757 length:468 start_codon:yes stop_codon:yes gene_type:complete
MSEDDNKTLLKVDFTEDDLWDADAALAKIIIPVLQELKKQEYFSLNVDLEDIPENLQWDLDEEDEPMVSFQEKSEYIIDEMIFAFDYVIDPDKYNDQHVTGVSDIRLEEQDDGLFLMTEGPNHTEVMDLDAIRANEDRCARGLSFFGKYYRNLWI